MLDEIGEVMQIQALPLGQRAVITRPNEKSIELISDGAVDYFEETFPGTDDEHYHQRMESGLRDVFEPRLVDSLAAISDEVSATGKLGKKTLNACARRLGSGWRAEARRETSFKERYRVQFLLGDPQGVATQRINFETAENRLDVQTFLPGPQLGAGSHSISGHTDARGRMTDLSEYLTAR